MKIRNHVFYGWYVVGASFVISILGTGILVNTLGTFIKPVSDALSLTRAQYSLTMSITALTGMITLPLWGKLIDHYSLRKLMLIFGLITSAAIFTLSLCSDLWQFYVCGAVIGFAGGSVSSLAISTLISRWFTDKRGMAVGLASSGSGLGPMLLIPATTSIISQQSWMTAYRFIAIVFLVLLVLAILVIRNSPRDIGLEAFRSEPGLVSTVRTKALGEHVHDGMTQAEAIRSKCFKYFIILFLLLGSIYGGTVNHIYAYLTDVGYDNSFASLVISLQMASLLIGKATLGIVLDKFGVRRGIPSALVAFIAALLFLIIARIQVFAIVYTILVGIGIAVIVVGSAYITGHYFGTVDYGKILSLFLASYSLGSTIGTFLSGFIFDRAGSYIFAWILYILFACSALLAFWKGDEVYRKIAGHPVQD